MPARDKVLNLKEAREHDEEPPLYDWSTWDHHKEKDDEVEAEPDAQVESEPTTEPKTSDEPAPPAPPVKPEAPAKPKLEMRKRPRRQPRVEFQPYVGLPRPKGAFMSATDSSYHRHAERGGDSCWLQGSVGLPPPPMELDELLGPLACSTGGGRRRWRFGEISDRDFAGGMQPPVRLPEMWTLHSPPRLPVVVTARGGAAGSSLSFYMRPQNVRTPAIHPHNRDQPPVWTRDGRYLGRRSMEYGKRHEGALVHGMPVPIGMSRLYQRLAEQSLHPVDAETAPIDARALIKPDDELDELEEAIKASIMRMENEIYQ